MSTRSTPPAAPALILATDLDGTFAGGTPEQRTALQQALASLPGAALIYVTGRTVEATRELMASAGLPHPDVLVADVGTTVVRGEGFEPLAEVELQLDRTWPGAGAIRERLREVAGIEEQEVRPPRRVSYWLREGEMEAVMRRMEARLEGLGVDLVGSAGTYIDVLPGGVNKGSTLRRVLQWLEREETEVVVAGDTLNDLALFQTGIAGIVVGNCELELRTRVGHLEHLFLAEGEGAAGILEGLRHFGWLPHGGEHGK